ncbi:MAG TPA: hypothetical protein VKV39_07005 [Candidatus Sulfotelmatobacter sp.]|nr:hypothetical protein [Candidatus Sulfotelmatobacter sp.]
MRLTWLISALSASLCLPAVSQSKESASEQTARHALIEMFLGTSPNDFAKHLPEDARRTLIRKGDTAESSLVLRIAEIARRISSQGAHRETFDIGPNILVADDRNGHDKLEVAVEHDSLLGDSEEIELSIHLYRDGEPKALPVNPRLLFTLQQEKEMWRLVELTVAAHIPLTDPDYLKFLGAQQDELSESAARKRLAMIAGAENRYAAAHADKGYTCSMPELHASSPQDGSAYSAGQSHEESSSYHFSITGCEGVPALGYRILAVPVDPDSEMKTFCTDQTGILKFAEGTAASCFSQGKDYVNTTADSTFTVD